MVKIGLFSDIHGDLNNLEQIIKTFEHEGIDSAVFLGDGIHQVMSQMTVKRAQEGMAAREKLMQDSGLRKAMIKGKYSDKQIKRLADGYASGTGISKKIARADYSSIKNMLSRLNDYIVLGGNWDYKEIKEVFEGNYLNADTRELQGINFTGFSGGGSPTAMTIPDEILADNQRTKDYKFREWAKAFEKEDIANTNVFISHVPFTDGEGIEKETAVEHLKDMITALNRKSRDKTPKVFINGHRHAPLVKYDKEINGFTINPGPGGKNHNEGIPTFMTAEFEDNKLTRLFKYEIKSSLEGLSNVVLAEEYVLDYENRKVERNKKDETVISTADKKIFASNLDLDDNTELINKGISIKYAGLSNEEKDALLRRNIAVMFKNQEETQSLMKKIIESAAFDSMKEGKVTKDTIEKIYIKLAEEAMKKFNANIDHVKEEDRDFYRDILINVAFGINSGELHYSLSKKIPENSGEISSWGNNLVKSAQNKLSNSYQNYLFRNLEAEDFQKMAELYLPLDYERKGKLMKEEARSLWITTYQNGILTAGDLSEYKHAYKFTKDFEKNPKTKQELAGMFGFKTSEQQYEEQLMDLLKEIEEKNGELGLNRYAKDRVPAKHINQKR
ncbi:metallophosphoesterase family protein [Candidatus Woesearchaeota archaeon]|nr:metallophosphoesterase family protein [Candidatus Woesearchaeota archaeon]